MTSTMDVENGKVKPPRRNNYFYGKLLDVAELEKEQRYFNQKRLMLNRLVLGSGVLCGLDVNPTAVGFIEVQPGVAIDALGREIVVPEPHVVNPTVLTDACGRPINVELPAESAVDIYLHYFECEVDAVPVLVLDCDSPHGCACSTVCEGYAIEVRSADDSVPEPPTCTVPDFPFAGEAEVHRYLCTEIANRDFVPSTETGIHLARINSWPLEEGLDICSGRQIVYSSAQLYELILCFAGRIADLAKSRILLCESGDGQVGTADETLANDIEVKVVDLFGNPVPRVRVEFEVTADGTTSPKSTRTNNKGIALTKWKLGPIGKRSPVEEQEPSEEQPSIEEQAPPETQFLTASAVGSIFTVRLSAFALHGPDGP